MVIKRDKTLKELASINNKTSIQMKLPAASERGKKSHNILHD